MSFKFLCIVYPIYFCLLLAIPSYGNNNSEVEKQLSKIDTATKHMTPSYIRTTADKRNFEIVFEESSLLFYCSTSPASDQNSIAYWKKLIANRHKVIVNFKKESDSKAKIISVQAYNL